MAKELGVKRGDQQGRLVHGPRQSAQFLGPARQIGRRMLFGFAAGGGGVVGLLLFQGTPLGRDPVQLEAKGAPAGDAAARQLLFRQIPAEIAVEFPIGPIAGVAIAGTPHRQGGTAVPAKEGHSPWGADRCKYPIAGPRQGMEEAMAIKHRVAQTVVDKDLVEALVVGAFR